MSDSDEAQQELQVGVVGLGTMGLPIATALAGASTPVLATDPSPAAATAAREAGLSVVKSVADLLDCDAVVLSLPGPAVVIDVVKTLAKARHDETGATPGGPVILDTSTVGPDDARQAAELAATAGLQYADCPILGRPGSIGQWTIPVGGSPTAQAVAARVFAAVARSVEGVGEIGAAATAKVLNNLMLGTINAVTAELLVLAEAAGLDPGRWVDLIVDSGAASISPLFRDVAARAVDDDFAPVFSVALMYKDNGLALALAERLGVPMLVGSATQQVNAAARAAGFDAEDSIAVIKPLEESVGLRARRHR